MALHQYIGARYVPKFYENSLGTADWVAGVIYEPLTIVTWNGNSYTSKKTVPASVGDPSSNPDYWVATGVFNQQLADLSDRMDAVEIDVTTLNEKAGYYTPEMYGAVGDGITDDSQAFAAMLADIPEGAVIILSAKKYIVKQQLNLTKNFVRISGIATSEYSPVIETDILSGALFKVTSAGCVFDNIQFSGPSRGATTACAVDFDGSSINGDCDGLVNECCVYRFEYGIMAGGRNVTVRSCNISAPRYGVIWYQLQNAVEHRGHIVENCRFHGVPVAVDNRINNTLHVKNLTVKNNVLDGESAIIFNGYSGGVNIKDNILYMVSGVTGAGAVIILNENADAAGFADADIVAGNILHIAEKDYAGIAVNGAVNAIIKDNIIEKSGRRGIYTTGAAAVIIANNTITDPVSWAIECSAGTSGGIVNNIVKATYAVTPGGATETGTVTVS